MFSERTQDNIKHADRFGIGDDTGLAWAARAGHRAYIIHDDSGDIQRYGTSGQR